MLVSFAFLLIMILAGGLVALMADKLGRTLGKKRLTLFGMRPRHTATTMTVAAGMLIPLITVLFVAAVSVDARRWIVEGNDALRQRDQLRSEVGELQTQKAETSSEIGGLKKQKDETVKALGVVQDKLRLATNEVRRVQAQEVRLTAEISRNQILIRNYQTQLRSKQGELVRANQQLKSADANLALEAKNLNDLTGKFKILRTSYDEIDRQRQQANDEYVKVSGANDQLTKVNSDLKDQIDKATNQLQTTQADLEFAKLNLDSAKLDLQQLRTQRDTIKGLFDINVSQPRIAHLAFNIGDELARVSIPAGSDANTVRGLFETLMNEAAQVATAGGASGNSTHEVVSLFPPPDDSDNQVSPDVQEQKIIDATTNSKDDLVLVATCELNTYMGEPVPVAVQYSGNPLVYKRNDKIAETAIDGTEPEEQIIKRISDFLTSTVQEKALKDHMIPIAGKAGSFGEVPMSDLLQVAHSIKDGGRIMRVTALADNDTHAADPLRLHFRVR